MSPQKNKKRKRLKAALSHKEQNGPRKTPLSTVNVRSTSKRRKEERGKKELHLLLHGKLTIVEKDFLILKVISKQFTFNHALTIAPTPKCDRTILITKNGRN